MFYNIPKQHTIALLQGNHFQRSQHRLDPNQFWNINKESFTAAICLGRLVAYGEKTTIKYH